MVITLIGVHIIMEQPSPSRPYGYSDKLYTGWGLLGNTIAKIRSMTLRDVRNITYELAKKIFLYGILVPYLFILHPNYWITCFVISISLPNTVKEILTRIEQIFYYSMSRLDLRIAVPFLFFMSAPVGFPLITSCINALYTGYKLQSSAVKWMRENAKENEYKPRKDGSSKEKKFTIKAKGRLNFAVYSNRRKARTFFLSRQRSRKKFRVKGVEAFLKVRSAHMSVTVST
jgi:hypothetical protein